MLNLIQEHQEILKWVGGVSLLMFFLSIAVLMLVIIWLPQDYFAREQRLPCHRHPKPSILWALVALLKNIIGMLLVLLGLVLLVLPGQGLLTILIGVSLTNFPGKFKLERRLVQQKAIQSSLNAIRNWAGKPSLNIPIH